MTKTPILTQMSYLQTPNAMIAPEWPPVYPLSMETTYELDPFQKHAILAIHENKHVFVTAKTGSGKTFVGEYLIAHHLKKGGRVFYTTPIKSLCNQKYHDLKHLFPENTVGIMTGDIKMCPQAQIVVMTAEILRNLIMKRGTLTEGVGLTSALSLDGVSATVMDEAHFIQDPDRGHVWEETLILCKGQDIQLALLSATMPSAASIATWIADLHQRQTVLLSTTYRIVPLVHGVLSDKNEVVPLLDAFGGWTDGYTAWLKSRKTRSDLAAAHKKAVANRLTGQPPPAHKIKEESATARLLRNIAWLHESGETPALFFVFSRKECERYASLVPNTLLDTSDTAAVKHIFDFHLSRHKATLETSAQYHTIRDLLSRGIAFHHSGLQPLLKEIVEILFTRKYVKILFATETFAVGLNMPTKTVVFLGMSKFSSGCQTIIRPDEYIQMAGRAGRRGLDTRGLVLYEPMHDPLEPHELKGLLTGSLRPFSSRMLFNYDFILKLKIITNQSALIELKIVANQSALIESSYWALEQGKHREELTQRIRAIGDKIEQSTKSIDDKEYETMKEHANLQEQVRTTVNAKQKRAKQALALWMMANDTKDLSARIQRYESRVWMSEEYLRLLQEARIPALNLDGKFACLQKWGFLDTENDLTPLGLCATEVNEGHVILMPLLAESECMKPLTGAEIAVVLATFLDDGNESDESKEASVVFDVAVATAFQWIHQTCKDCIVVSQDTVDSCNSWKLSRTWPLVVNRWISGANISDIAIEFGMFEGNVFRGLLRIANLLEEWSAIATLRKDLATLEKLANLHFLRGEIVPDSLYLRL